MNQTLCKQDKKISSLESTRKISRSTSEKQSDEEVKCYLSWHDKVVPDNVHHSVICEDAGDQPRPESRWEVGHEQEAADGSVGSRAMGDLDCRGLRTHCRTAISTFLFGASCKNKWILCNIYTILLRHTTGSVDHIHSLDLTLNFETG